MEPKEIRLGSFVVVILLIVIATCMWGCPAYRVYNQRKSGEADLAQAQYSRQVAVAEARAKMESAALLSQADSLRAIGVAASNRIIAASITTQYLQWKWIDEIKATNQIIYIPSGNMGLPILEANRLQKPITPPEP